MGVVRSEFNKMSNTIAEQSSNTALQNQLKEYQQRYGKLNGTPN